MSTPSRDSAVASGTGAAGGLADRIRCALLWVLPQHAISRLLYALTRVRSRAKDPIVRWFIRRFGVDMSEAAESDPRSYASFNEFFTRALRADARPLTGDERTLISPVDGRLSAHGAIADGRLLQAKGIDYSLRARLGGEDATRFAEGSFATLYLAPGDYHRIHMPLRGRLTHMAHVPGRLYSVAPWTVAVIDGLFARNERVCAFFETDAGPLGLVLVGAINVAAIETTWAGLVTPPRGRRVQRWDYDAE
ncbi:MAG: archaetidylserine decarboxylase, partial [Halofilum sp. (in: g-proteobacteria)]